MRYRSPNGLIRWLRRRPDSNRRMKVLQTFPLPLGYGANGCEDNRSGVACKPLVLAVVALQRTGERLERQAGATPSCRIRAQYAKYGKRL